MALNVNSLLKENALFSINKILSNNPKDSHQMGTKETIILETSQKDPKASASSGINVNFWHREHVPSSIPLQASSPCLILPNNLCHPQEQGERINRDKYSNLEDSLVMTGARRNFVLESPASTTTQSKAQYTHRLTRQSYSTNRALQCSESGATFPNLKVAPPTSCPGNP